MATTIDKKLFSRLRSAGVRKRVAKDLSSTRASKTAQGAIGDLRKLVDELEERARGGSQKRRAAAKKAAATRKRRATARSKAARKAARTRSRTTR
jgi:hypothetical protein